jgi:hypothetical protein
MIKGLSKYHPHSNPHPIPPKLATRREMPKSKRLPTPRHRCGTVTLLLMPPLPLLPYCRSQHQAVAAAQTPSCHRKAAITAATAITLLQCCHHRRCHHCCATTAAIELLLPRCRQAANIATTTVVLLQCCHCRCCHCCCAAAAAAKLPPPSCRHQAAAASAPPPSCRRGHHRCHTCRNKTLYICRNT